MQINLHILCLIGIDVPRSSRGPHSLPSPRAVSAHVHRDEGLHDHAITIMTVAWGQAIDHDLTLTGETKCRYLILDKCI